MPLHGSLPLRRLVRSTLLPPMRRLQWRSCPKTQRRLPTTSWPWPQTSQRRIRNGPRPRRSWGSSFRDDLAANLGGDFLLSLDGPVLPTPSWKAVIEVNNPQRLETYPGAIGTIPSRPGSGYAIASACDRIERGRSGQRFYSVQDLTSGATVAQYTFSDGYMIVAPNRALLMEALRTHASGDSLARSTAFKALLPKDAE